MRKKDKVFTGHIVSDLIIMILVLGYLSIHNTVGYSFLIVVWLPSLILKYLIIVLLMDESTTNSDSMVDLLEEQIKSRKEISEKKLDLLKQGKVDEVIRIKECFKN